MHDLLPVTPFNVLASGRDSTLESRLCQGLISSRTHNNIIYRTRLTPGLAPSAGGKDHTTDCYLSCYFNALVGDDVSQLPPMRGVDSPGR